MDAFDKLLERWQETAKLSDMRFIQEQWKKECEICKGRSSFPHCLPSCVGREGGHGC